jgi:hypothetical protein
MGLAPCEKILAGKSVAPELLQGSWEVGRLVLAPEYRTHPELLKTCFFLTLMRFIAATPEANFFASCNALLSRLYRRFGFSMLLKDAIEISGEAFSLIHGTVPTVAAAVAAATATAASTANAVIATATAATETATAIATAKMETPVAAPPVEPLAPAPVIAEPTVAAPASAPGFAKPIVASPAVTAPIFPRRPAPAPLPRPFMVPPRPLINAPRPMEMAFA